MGYGFFLDAPPDCTVREASCEAQLNQLSLICWGTQLTGPTQQTTNLYGVRWFCEGEHAAYSHALLQHATHDGKPRGLEGVTGQLVEFEGSLGYGTGLRFNPGLWRSYGD